MRNRNIKVNVFLSEEEKKIFDRKSKKAGLSKSDFFRKIILDYQLKEKPDDRFYDMLSQLRGIAKNLNQMTRVYNMCKGSVPDYEISPLLKKVEDFILDIQRVYLLPEKETNQYGNY